MLVGCPKCKTKYKITGKNSTAETGALRCRKCGCLFRVSGKTSAPSEVKDAGGPSERRVRVLVAHESPVFCRAVEKVLSTEPFDVNSYNDGKSALEAVERLAPDVLLIDVALPVMYGFEVCEAVRKNPQTASVKIILIAAIYDRSRYKREPHSLYGADDYIEKHHITDNLAAGIYQLVYGSESPQAATHRGEKRRTEMPVLSVAEMAELESTRISLDNNEKLKPEAAVTPEDSEMHAKARRLAGLIAADIALYNPELVEEGVRTGTFYKLLEEDIRDGHELYGRRVPAAVRSGTRYLEQAFEDLVSRKKREMNIAMESGVHSG